MKKVLMSIVAVLFAANSFAQTNSGGFSLSSPYPVRHAAQNHEQQQQACSHIHSHVCCHILFENHHNLFFHRHLINHSQFIMFAYARKRAIILQK